MRGWTALNLALWVALAGCATVPWSFHPVEPLAPRDFSHELFEDILRAHVLEGIVNYPAIEHDGRFRAYISQLDRVDPNSLPTRQDRLALWINAYNAFAIQGILDGYSPMTLFGRYRYFIARTYRVGGETISLYDLERKLLIPEFREPRIHFAIVCASSSCPRLHSWTYQADKLEGQLEQSARDFINDPARNRFDRARKVAYLSMIFKWFEEDFIAHSGSLLRYAARYVSDQETARDLEADAYTIEFLEYDWRLNGPSPNEQPHARLSQ